ncbi:MAG TPA: hypothetical protein VHA52_01695, partial [Candidatus Babeliaceae bacterium]|nr:hypothetical protein [Candidatus Babeliaceae bacterium]
VHVAIMLIAVHIIYTVLRYLVVTFFNNFSIDALLFSFIALLIMMKIVSPLMQGIGLLVGSLVYLII